MTTSFTRPTYYIVYPQYCSDPEFPKRRYDRRKKTHEFTYTASWGLKTISPEKPPGKTSFELCPQQVKTIRIFTYAKSFYLGNHGSAPTSHAISVKVSKSKSDYLEFFSTIPTEYDAVFAQAIRTQKIKMLENRLVVDALIQFLFEDHASENIKEEERKVEKRLEKILHDFLSSMHAAYNRDASLQDSFLSFTVCNGYIVKSKRRCMLGPRPSDADLFQYLLGK